VEIGPRLKVALDLICQKGYFAISVGAIQKTIISCHQPGRKKLLHIIVQTVITGFIASETGGNRAEGQL
jgi:hypothetical protein